MFLSLRNARAKTNALDAAANLTLSKEDYELFLALMRYKDTTEKERNDLAHGVYGVSASVPKGIVWVSAVHYASFSANVRGLGLTEEIESDFSSKRFVYEIGDLETIAREIENLERQISSFQGYLGSDNLVWRATRYPQLCSEPRLQRELDHLRQHQKNDSSGSSE